MKITRKEKQIIRNYWGHMPIRFRANGTVEGKKGECWGILLTKHQLEEELKRIRGVEK